MSGLRTEKPLQCRNLAMDRDDLLYQILRSACKLIMSYKGGAGKDFFIFHPCHFSLFIAVFGLRRKYQRSFIFLMAGLQRRWVGRVHRPGQPSPLSESRGGIPCIGGFRLLGVTPLPACLACPSRLAHWCGRARRTAELTVPPGC